MSAFGTGTRTMQGSLFAYAPGRQAFVTGSLQRKAAVARWIERRPPGVPVRAAAAKAWRRAADGPARPLRSSYAQFGFKGLDNDVKIWRSCSAARRSEASRNSWSATRQLADARALRETRQSREETERVPRGGVSDARRTRSRRSCGGRLCWGAVAGRHGQGRRVPAARVPLVRCPASRHRRDSRLPRGRP